MPLIKSILNLFQPSTSSELQSSGLLTFTDSRDGKVYKTVKICNQVWMAENLNYAAPGSKCYENSDDNGIKYGRLYNWEAAMNACPAGWHLPSDAEWTTLENFVGGRDMAGKKLKSTSDWINNGNGTDEYGFSALPGGYGNNGEFNTLGYAGGWWCATDINAINAWSRAMVSRNDVVNIVNRDPCVKSTLFSVRCVQDTILSTFTDSRDGKIYKTVKIGNQVWMAENLNYVTPKSIDNGAKYGRLYYWEEAMSACPAGWHLPTKEEWSILVTYAGGASTAGKKLKSTSGWAYLNDGSSGNGTDDYGFSALPGGTGGELIGLCGGWWSATENDASKAWYLSMGCNGEFADGTNFFKNAGFSVRCVQD